ncbi:hypothetical protein [Hasllibacter halocynthiae]|uniref:hypothetical protein n=1 Tax=Hasllibacter halocynthiae TaxID=595589 RepID=UPI00147503C8|nr:hypothetical protein [Hasllibacter halocynthiae]
MLPDLGPDFAEGVGQRARSGAVRDLGKEHPAVLFGQVPDPFREAEIEEQLRDRHDAAPVLGLHALLCRQVDPQAQDPVAQLEVRAAKLQDLADPGAERFDNERNPVERVAENELAGHPAAVGGGAAPVDRGREEPRQPLLAPGLSGLGLRAVDVERVSRAFRLQMPFHRLVAGHLRQSLRAEGLGRLPDPVHAVAVALDRLERQARHQAFPQDGPALGIRDALDRADFLRDGGISGVRRTDPFLLRPAAPFVFLP